MKIATETRDPYNLAELLQMLVNRCYANINDPHLYCYPGVGTKLNVETFLVQVQRGCEFLLKEDWGDHFDRDAKEDFVQSAMHTHGRTALCLSGLEPTLTLTPNPIYRSNPNFQPERRRRVSYDSFWSP